MKKIILASASPRRKELLGKYPIDLVIKESDITEIINNDYSPASTAMSLALQKALDIVDQNSIEDIVIAADTIVVCNDIMLGKPEDEEDATSMIKLLSENEHYVITGVAIIHPKENIKVVDYDLTKVRFRGLSDEKIRQYIETKEYEGKAGAYGIQGYGETLVDFIEGSYSNVVGLPISKVDYLLEKYFSIGLL